MTNLDPIKHWYSGKALRAIEDYVIPTLVEAEAQGFWQKHASRKVRAALNKQTVARKFALYQLERGVLPSIFSGDGASDWRGEGRSACHAMEFGRVQDAPHLVTALQHVANRVKTSEQAEAFRTAFEWAKSFAPVAELLDLLDSRRPPRVLVLGTLSPLVAEHLGASLQLKLKTCRFPKFVRRWIKWTDPKTNRECKMCVVDIIWPEGTLHGTSRYKGTAENQQCEACGHAIKSPFNWVPLVIDDRNAVPHSFWVGRDCAGKLFGVKVEGEGLYAERMK